MAITELEQPVVAFKQAENRKGKKALAAFESSGSMADCNGRFLAAGLEHVAPVPVENLMSWVSIPAMLIMMTAIALQVVA